VSLVAGLAADEGHCVLKKSSDVDLVGDFFRVKTTLRLLASLVQLSTLNNRNVFVLLIIIRQNEIDSLVYSVGSFVMKCKFVFFGG